MCDRLSFKPAALSDNIFDGKNTIDLDSNDKDQALSEENLENKDMTQLEGSTQEVQEASISSTTKASSALNRPAARTLTTLKKKSRKGKDTLEKPTFEEIFMSI